MASDLKVLVAVAACALLVLNGVGRPAQAQAQAQAQAPAPAPAVTPCDACDQKCTKSCTDEAAVTCRDLCDRFFSSPASCQRCKDSGVARCRVTCYVRDCAKIAGCTPAIPFCRECREKYRETCTSNAASGCEKECNGETTTFCEPCKANILAGCTTDCVGGSCVFGAGCPAGVVAPW